MNDRIIKLNLKGSEYMLDKKYVKLSPYLLYCIKYNDHLSINVEHHIMDIIVKLCDSFLNNPNKQGTDIYQNNKEYVDSLKHKDLLALYIAANLLDIKSVIDLTFLYITCNFKALSPRKEIKTCKDFENIMLSTI